MGGEIVTRACQPVPMKNGCKTEKQGKVKETLCVCDTSLCNYANSAKRSQNFNRVFCLFTTLIVLKPL